VRTVLAVGALAAALVASGVAPQAASSATGECRGFLVCVPIAGPWVVVPTGLGVPRQKVEYQLTCPRGFVVGGLDAELTARAIDVAFLGTTGSPVNPGITTSRSVVFVATYVGASSQTQTFRPHIGCIPASGGGRRTPTAVTTVVPPGKAIVRRVRTVRVPPTVRTVVQSCAADERLVAGAVARGFYTKKPPSQELVSTVSATPTIRAGSVRAVIRGDDAMTTVRAVVQVSAVCAGGR
jgi:hypothetical protein